MGGCEAGRKYTKTHISALFNVFREKDRKNLKQKLGKLGPKEYLKRLEKEDENVCRSRQQIMSYRENETTGNLRTLIEMCADFGNNDMEANKGKVSKKKKKCRPFFIIRLVNYFFLASCCFWK